VLGGTYSRSAFFLKIGVVLRIVMRKKRRNIKGFSLAEAMLATIVLAIAAAGVLLPFTAGAAIRTDGVRRTLAAKLASDMVERILCTDFDNIVGSYGSVTENEGEVRNSSGVIFTDSNYAKFSRSVTCEYVHVLQEIDESPERFILVTVSVYYDGTEMAVVRRLISK